MNLKEYFKKVDEFKRLQKEMDELKKEFESHCKSEWINGDSKKIISFDKTSNLVITKVTRKTIKWDVGKLKKTLPDDLQDDCFIKTATIIDLNEFINYVKSLGADPKKIKKLINVVTTVDSKKIDVWNDIGVINMEMLEGTYDVIEGTSYFKLSKKEISEE